MRDRPGQAMLVDPSLDTLWRPTLEALLMPSRPLVLDTNIVLDLLVFQDPATAVLAQALRQQRLHWIATVPMRDELVRVLAYPQVVKCQQRQESLQALAKPGGQTGSSVADGDPSQSSVLASFDALARIVAVAVSASATCKDPDDQKFIDLAVAHRALLLSRDKAVLCMKKRLLALDVTALAAII